MSKFTEQNTYVHKKKSKSINLRWRQYYKNKSTLAMYTELKGILKKEKGSIPIYTDGMDKECAGTVTSVGTVGRAIILTIVPGKRMKEAISEDKKIRISTSRHTDLMWVPEESDL